jgi:predicted nucleic acid-binding protein
MASVFLPIIALAKIGRLEMLKELYESVLILPSVKEECIDRGRELGASDMRYIEKAIEDGWIKVVKLDRKQRRTVNGLISKAKIALGEAEALVLAKGKNLLTILDDKEARAIARSWVVELHGTVMVLYEAYVKGKLSYDQLIEDLTKLSRVMWVSSDVIAEVIKRAKGVKR